MSIDIKNNYAVFDKRATLSEHILSNSATLLLLAFCAWIAKDSTWWTFVTGLFFLFYMFTQLAKVFKERNNVFKTKADLQKWVDGLEEL